MSTALAPPPATIGGPPVPRRPGPLRRVGALRHTSPGRLQLLLAVLLTLGVFTGLTAGLTGRSAAAGTGDLGRRAQPLLAEAETIYSALADADTTAAQAFLAGGLEPPPLTRRYEDDLARATAALTSAARRTPEGSTSADVVQGLAAGVARYAGLVATARATNRQGLPVGASYLSAASTLNRQTLLPQAQSLFRIAQREVGDGYRDAASAAWIALLALLTVALLAALVAGQIHLSRATKRTFNLPLLAATALTLLFAAGAGGVLAGQNVHLDRAGEQGSAPAAALAEARILALRERGDEALTLAARGGGGAYETDFQQTSRDLRAALDRSFPAPSAADSHRLYVEQHGQVRRLDDGGDYDAAVARAIGPQTTRPFEAMTAALDAALAERKAVFTDEIGAAGRGLGALTVLGPLAALVVCGLAVAGIRARLEEYR